MTVKPSHRNRNKVFPEQILSVAAQYENSILSKQLYLKVIKIEKVLLFLNIASIYSIIATFDLLNVPTLIPKTLTVGSLRVLYSDVFLIVNSAFSLALMLFKCFHAYAQQRLNYFRGKNLVYYRFRDPRSLATFALYQLVYLVHPNYLFQHVAPFNVESVLSVDLGDTVGAQYTFNDITCICCLLRVVPIGVYLVSALNYSSDVSDRIWLAHKQDQRLRPRRALRRAVPLQAEPNDVPPRRVRHHGLRLRHLHPFLRVPLGCVG